MKQTFKYIIIGGGVAGTTAAETIRKNDATGGIAVVSDEPYRFYSRLILSKPNFFLGKIPFDSVWLRKEAWYPENKIELIAGRTAIEFNPKSKEISLDNGDTLVYEKLLLALGTKPNIWSNDDTKKDGIYYLRSVDDGRRIMEAIKTAKKSAVIGGGFIGLEMCELLRMAGLPTSFFIREKFFWDYVWDETSARMVETAMDRHGVDIHLNVTVEAILGDGRVSGARLSNGRTVEFDMLIIGIGTHFPLNWLRQSGLEIGKGILANEFLETNIPDVWTAGDVAEYEDNIIGSKVLMGNWANAQEQGRVAGGNMSAEKKPFRFVSFYTTQAFGVSIAFLGDVSPKEGRDIVYRGSYELNSYSRLILDSGRLVGATMINRTAELQAISKIIEKRSDISDKIERLDDVAFDLKQLA